MLERLAAWVLNTYIGEYVENLNTDQLSIGLLQGEVELENLPLKKDAFDHLNLPIKVLCGYIGKIRLQIPVYRLRSEPWVINVENLYIVIGPIPKASCDVSNDEESIQDAKVSRLDAVEARWKASKEAKQELSYYASSYSSWLSYGTSLVTNIVENLQLKIKDVHIRYEDDSTIPNNSFACGLLIKHLSAESADESWVPKYVFRENTDIMRKLLELNHLAVYWDIDATMIGHLEMEEFINSMQKHMESCFTRSGSMVAHNYLLSPVCANAHLQRNCSPKPIRSRNVPRFICDLQLEKIPLTLTEHQYKQIVEWLTAFKYHEKPKTVMARRPSVPLKNNAQQWWKFAIDSHLEPIKAKHFRSSLKYALIRAKLIVEYAKIYQVHLTQPEGITSTMKAKKDDIECEMNFEELLVLRQLVMKQLESTQQRSDLASKNELKGRGFLQGLFPGWSGWYATDGEKIPENDTSKSKDETDSLENKLLENEILDSLGTIERDTVLMRDTVLARLNFSLTQGTFMLIGHRGYDITISQPSQPARVDNATGFPIIELEFFNVKTSLETRPRSGSYMFEINLGALYLHDRVIPNPVFPHIISPQVKTGFNGGKQPTMMGLRSPLYRSYGPTSFSPVTSNVLGTISDGPLFHLCYEHKPLSSKSDFRLAINTRPLDIVYNPVALDVLVKFFSLAYYQGHSVNKFEFSEAARSHYESIKQQTKAELKQKLGQILDGDEIGTEAIRWEISLDISAPQIIVPENLLDNCGTVVVFDLGRLKFSNSSPTTKKSEKSGSEDDDSDESDNEEFKTPCSSPVSEDSYTETAYSFSTYGSSTYTETEQNEELSLKDRFYERYVLELNDMQVLVSKAKDSWKFFKLKGTSPLHIIDKFSINVLLERCLIHTTDPLWPAVTISGKLPKLELHVNESKVQALRSCFEMIRVPINKSVKSKLSGSSEMSETDFQINSEISTKETNEVEEAQNKLGRKNEVTEASVIVIAQFSVDCLTLEVQSRGQSIAELQVSGVKTTLTRRLCDTSLTLCVHSLLLVDAMQTYGPDFELLIASNKHVCMDSMSGSLKDSEPNSPVSPASPESVSPNIGSPSSAATLTAALSDLQSHNIESKGFNANAGFKKFHVDDDALITVELLILHPQDFEMQRIVSVQFNNLDVTANQKTLVELLNFISCVTTEKPKEDVVSPQRKSETNFDASTGDAGGDAKLENVPTKTAIRTEVTFDFHRLTVLLLRAVSKNKYSSGQKLATATMSGAKIHALFGDNIEISGALGGLQVLDLMSEGVSHQRILSVGNDPLSTRHLDLMNRLESTVYKPASYFLNTCKPEKALTFSAKISMSNDLDKRDSVAVVIRMASVCYTHSPQPLFELALCVSEFKDYIQSLASSIKMAAAEVAKGIVHRWPEMLPSMSGRDELSESFYNIDQLADVRKSGIDVELDVILQTPIIVLPEKPSSPHVLVAHLGRITLQNISSSAQSDDYALYNCDPFVAETLFLEIKDMNIYSLNVEDNMKKLIINESSPAFLPVHELYSCQAFGRPILHNIVIECTVQKSALENRHFDPLSSSNDMIANNYVFQINGEVVRPLQIALSKHQYEQVLITLDNIIYTEMNFGMDESLNDEQLPQTSSNDEMEYKSEPLKVPLEQNSNFGYPSFVPVKATFRIPEFTVNLSSEMGEESHILVEISFQDFTLEYDKKVPFQTALQISLHGLRMEDLLESVESKHRLLMVSVSPPEVGRSQKPHHKLDYVSNSCPNLIGHVPLMTSHLSLPDELHTENLFKLQQGKFRKISYTSSNYSQTAAANCPDPYPSTPPPSPSASKEDLRSRVTNLVHINMVLVDSRSPQFISQHNSTHKFTDIDFNCLETTINLQTWVMVFDFFGIGVDVQPEESSSVSKQKHLSRQNSAIDFRAKGDEVQPINSEVEIRINSLSLMLNKDDYELAKVNISKFSMHMSLKEDNMSMKGTLGSMSLFDLTPYGSLYREKFATTGSEALHFDIYKYGKPDSEMKRDCDIRAKFQMSSVRYIHSQRFQTETLAFFQCFNQLQDFMARIRATAAGMMLNNTAMRGSRISLDIKAESPVIIIPHCHSSVDVLVAVLGRLTVHNKFLFAGSPDTISKVTEQLSPAVSVSESESDMDLMSQSVFGSLSDDSRNNELERVRFTSADPGHVCLLDVMHLELADMDLYSALRIDRCDLSSESQASAEIEFASYVIKREGGPLLNQKFKLDVQVERNLDSDISHNVPDMTMQGVFSSVHFIIDLLQYKLVLGILNHNLGEPTEDFSCNTGKHQEPSIQTILSAHVWTCTAINLDLVNVTLELVNSHPTQSCANSGSPLAKFNFIKSRLSYESYSDDSKDIDLVSHEIRVSDTRYHNEPVNTRPNVFTNILQPTLHDRAEASLLQAEVHYRSNKEVSRFTVLLNNMRVMGIIDWLKKVLEFLYIGSEAPPGYNTIAMSKISSTTVPQNMLKYNPAFELKLNVTDTELVIVEEPGAWDTNAVILKSTAVLSYRSGAYEKPLCCSLQRLEVFSAILGIEEETALSIIDPVTINMDVTGKSCTLARSTLSHDNVIHTAEISMMNANLRLSYHDVTMFLRIFKSIQLQTGIGLEVVPSQLLSPVTDLSPYTSKSLEQLKSLGFSETDCLQALDACQGKVDEAALWLTSNASLPTSVQATETSELPVCDRKTVNLQCVEIRIGGGCLCIIDDCDADVPLLEMSVSEFYLYHKFGNGKEGTTVFILNSDYYNRFLSGWEPFLEPWKCSVTWKRILSAQNHQRLNLKIQADAVLNVNITSTLLELYNTVKTNWIEDYYKLRNGCGVEDAIQTANNYKQRQPFVPFALKNETGCKLKFSTVVTSDRNLTVDSTTVNDANSAWKTCEPGQVITFSFEGRRKIRHRDSHELKVHQVIVQIEGWQVMPPVSLDRVGIYFRHAKPQLSHSPFMFVQHPVARVVFEVTLEGSAKKQVTIRSALQVKNMLEETIELRLQHTGTYYGAAAQVLYLVPKTTFAVPLHFVYAKMHVRPLDQQFAESSDPITWQHENRQRDVSGALLTCKHIRVGASYRLCACAYRENFPVTDNSSQLPEPGHRIDLVPPFQITNCLPYELYFTINPVGMKGYIKSGKSIHLHNVDLEQMILLNVALENFCKCTDLSINPGCHDFVSRMELYDQKDRLLLLTVRVSVMPGGALMLNVSAPYWVVNRTGLPIIFRQDGAQAKAAGQLREHETARSVMPLLFSFADSEASFMCKMRVGKTLHLNARPQWCGKFHLEKGITVRRLRVSASDCRPDWVYIIGIEVKMGKGQYQDTYIVTLSPRYHLHNGTNNKLEIAQKFAISEEHLEYRSHIMMAMPKCSMPFHWPRVDFDNLLCVRIVDVPDCHWSGGFLIDKINSFHLNLRGEQGKSLFLRVEVVLHGATFFIVFTNTDKMLPPFRVDNHSEVLIHFYQTTVGEERLEMISKPHSSIPYAFDEPTLPSFITCRAPGGSSATYNMDVFREGQQLFYENFIYIAFTGTFGWSTDSSQLISHNPNDHSTLELVLDVPQGTRVVLSRKELGKRSQLWRMTSTGQLQHEGSSPPRDIRRPSSSMDNSRILVLDSAGIVPLPGEYVPLMLRKPDERRRLTQTWRFTEEGRLCCNHPNMYVQAKDGFYGMKSGNDVVLGPPQPVSFSTMPNGIPVEQAISVQKLRQGSGVLAVKVVPDGPTRVLQITDFRNQQMITKSNSKTDWVVVECQEKNSVPLETPKTSVEPRMEIELAIHLSGGLGISLINTLGEELIYAFLQNIMVEYVRSVTGHTFDSSVQNIQVDNQLRDAERSVILYITPYNNKDLGRHMPAIHITANKTTMIDINAEIFKHLIVTTKSITLQLEDKLLMKMLQFFGLPKVDSENENQDEQNTQMPVPLPISSAHACRYYFSMLKLFLPQVRLSVSTSQLPPQLLEIKKKMGWTLISFDDALIELDPFVSVHPFETMEFLVDSIIDHYREELKSQAAKIFGAVDFLGNPLGLMYDVSEGFSGLINDGNVGGLIKNVAHGLSNTAAKMTGTLSDSLGMVAMDDKHQQFRKKLRQDNAGSSSDHLVAGLKGLGYGILGGVTSIVSQTYEGAATQGAKGFFAGLGKGLVGTVTKPTVGVLDFAAGAASAVRDTSKRRTHSTPSRVRPPRPCIGKGGLLLMYSLQQAQGQELLYSLNDRNYAELCIAYEQIQTVEENLRILVSSRKLYILSRNPPSVNVFLTIPFKELDNCRYLSLEVGDSRVVKHYLEFISEVDSAVAVERKAPKVRCDSIEIAQKVSQLVNYAKNLYEETKYTVAVGENKTEI